jgi:hypothetical protein
MSSEVKFDFHCRDSRSVLKGFNVDESKGLSSKQVEEQRAKFGPNEIPARKTNSLSSTCNPSFVRYSYHSFSFCFSLF